MKYVSPHVIRNYLEWHQQRFRRIHDATSQLDLLDTRRAMDACKDDGTGDLAQCAIDCPRVIETLMQMELARQ